MACFLTPLIAALIVTLLQRIVRGTGARLRTLATLLWGGSFVLAVEHVLSGELVPWPPFLTAATPAGMPALIQEMIVVGLPMTGAVFAAWGAIQMAPKMIASLARLKSTFSRSV